MKRIVTVGLVAVSCFLLTSCYEDSVAGKESAYQTQLMEQAINEVGMPDITEFYEKKLAKEIFERRDDSSLICYVYNQAYNGKYIYIGMSMGYGLPYSTQYTNPEAYTRTMARYGDSSLSASYEVLPQADPNGLYSATGLSATWLMMIDDATGENYIMYCEPTIVVTENKLPVRLLEEWSLTENY